MLEQEKQTADIIIFRAVEFLNLLTLDQPGIFSGLKEQHQLEEL
jgi:hypothetical protein